MHETDSFLKDEIDVYHDVRPIIKQTEEIEKVEEKDDSGKGLFRIFNKKSSEEREVEPVIEKSSEKPVLLSENVVQNIIDSDSFLQDEVKNYHDVRPVIKETIEPVETQKSPKKETKEHGKGLFGIFKKKTDDKYVDKQEDRAVFSETVLQSMQQTDSFLKDEIDVYHDVRPIVKQTEEIEKVEEKEDSGKGLFGIFKKKSSEEREVEPVIEKSSEKPVLLSENVVQNIIDSDSFLQDEVKNYHDVRPVIKEKIEPVETQKSPKKEKKEHGKGLFGIFKKKTGDKDIESKVDKEEDRAGFSETVIQSMHDTDSFLKDEVDIYHDVRPIIKQTEVSEKVEGKEDSGKGLFAIFKKKSSEEREVESVVEKSPEKSVLLSMQETDSFLKDEVDRYHDVMPVLCEEQRTEKVEEKDDSGRGLFGIFKKKPSEDREIEPVIIKPVEKFVPGSENVVEKIIESDSFLKDEIEKHHDVRPVIKQAAQPLETQKSPKKGKKEHGKGLFGIFKKKSDDSEVEKIEDKLVISENVLQQMQNADSFLKDEVDKYHDVKPIIQQVSGTEIQIEEPKQRKVVPTIEKLPEPPKLLSENVLKNMIESDTFLKEEVGKYHDVRPVIEKPDEVVDAPKEVKTEAKLFGLLKKKPSEEKEVESQIIKSDAPTMSKQVVESTPTSDSFLKDEVQLYHDVRPIIEETITVKVTPTKKPRDKTKEDGKGLFGIFSKKPSEEREVESEIEKQGAQQVLSETVQKEMIETDSFLKDEVELFHDVRPIIKESPERVTEKSPEKSKREKEKQEGKGLFGLFKKKPSEERDVLKEKIEKPVLSEVVLKDMADADSFLKDEVEYYHDVRPIVVESEKENISPEKIKKDKKREGKGLFGIFKKKPSEEKEVEPKIRQSKDKPVLSEETVQGMKVSDSFLKDEVENYHDVYPIIARPVEVTEREEEKVEGEGIFAAIFKTKPSEDKEIESMAGKAKTSTELSETVLKEMQESDTLLKDEIEKYHDARLVISHPISIEKEITEKSKKETGLLGLFKKGPSEEKKTAITEDVKTKTGKAEQKPQRVVTETVSAKTDIAELEDPTFKTEVAKYHEVGPVVKETITITKVLTTDKPKDQAIDLESWETKVSEEKDTEFDKILGKPMLSGPTVQAMNDSDAFLHAEIEKFYDVRPIVTAVASEDKSVKEKPEEKKGGFLGLFKKKPSEEREVEQKIKKLEETVVSESSIIKEKAEETEGGLFGIFKKKHADDKEPKSEATPAISEEVLRDMNDTDTFLKDEVDKYHDVRPVDMDTKKEPHEKGEEQSGVLGIFKKEKPSKKEENVTEVEEQNIPETTNFLNTELEKYEDADYVVKPESKIQEKRRKSLESKKPPGLSQTVIADMINTSNFIREEISKYHDVKPQIQKEVVKPEEEKPGKSGKLFGLFGKKRSQDREISVEADKKAEKKVEKEKKKSKSKDKSDAKGKHVIATATTTEATDSKDFYKGEIDRYQQPDESVKFSETEPQEVEEHVREKSGFFGLFSKKTKPQEHIEELKTTKDESGELLKRITDTDDFLKTEIDKFHDVFPQTDLKEGITEGPESLQITEVMVPESTSEMKKFLDESTPTTDITVIKEITPMGERVTTIRKEVLVFKDTIQLDPSVITDLSELERDIQKKLEQVKGEIDKEGDVKITEIHRTVLEGVPKEDSYKIKEVIQTGPSGEEFSTKIILEPDKTLGNTEKEVILHEDVKPPSKEAAETETEKKSGLFGLFGKRKSQEREIFPEKYTPKPDDQIIPESPKTKKKSGSPLKIFGKRQSEEKTQKLTDDADSKPGVLSEEALIKMQNTHSFLSTERENYEDGKPELITDLDEDMEQVKSSGLFGIFSKKDKVSSPKAHKKKIKKQKSGSRSVEDSGFIEKIEHRTTDAAREELEEGARINENIVKTAEDITKDTIQHAEQLIDTTGHGLKSTGKKVSFADLKEDIINLPTEIIDSIKEDGKDKITDISDTVQGEIKKTQEGSELILEDVTLTGAEVSDERDDLFDEIDKVIRERSDDINKILDDTRYQTQERFQDVKSYVKEAQQETAKEVEDVKHATIVTAKDGVEESQKAVKKSGRFFGKLGEKIASKTEIIKDDVKLAKEDTKEKVDDLTKQSIDTMHEVKQSVQVASTSEPVEKRDKKTKKSFFSKLSGKIGVKGDEIKDSVKELEKSAEATKSETLKKVEKTLGDVKTTSEESRKSIVSDVSSEEAALREETSSFVTEIMQSFDDTLEHVKDEELAAKNLIKEGKQDLVRSVSDVKYKAEKKGAELGEIFESNTRELKEKGKEALVDAKDTASKAEDTFVQRVDAKFSDTVKLTEQMTLESQQRVKDSVSPSEMFIEGEKETARKDLQLLSSELTDLAKDISKTGEQMLYKTHTLPSELADQVDDKIEVAEKKVEELSKDVKEATSKGKVASGIESIGKSITKAEESVKDAVEDTKQATTKAGKKTGKFFSKLSDKISGKSKEIEHDLKDAESKIKPQIVDTKTFVDEKSEKIVSTAPKVIEDVEEKYLEGQKKVVTETKSAIKEVEGAAKDIKDDYHQTIQKTVVIAKDEMKDTSQKAKEETSRLAQDVNEITVKATKGIKDDVKDASVKTMEETRGLFVQIGEYISGKTKEVDEKINETVDKTEKEKLEEGVAIAVQNVEDAASASIQEITDSSLESIVTVKEAVIDTGDKAIKTVDKSVTEATKKLDSEVASTADKAKKSKPKFLGKLSKKLSVKGDEQKEKSEEELPKESDQHAESHKKGIGFFTKLGDKITGKADAEKRSVERDIVQTTDSVRQVQSEAYQQEASPLLQSVRTDPKLDIKKRTYDFLESESILPDSSSMTRTTSDYGSAMKGSVYQDQHRISEANIDLSNLPTNVEEFASESEKKASSYVTSPTLARRAISQRFPKGERPEVVEIRNFEIDDISDDEFYIVTEPEEFFTTETEDHRKPLFHIASEDDENSDPYSGKPERQDSAKSNILESLTEQKLECLLSDLTKDLSKPLDIKTPLEKEIKKEEKKLQEHKKESQAEVDIIEKKLRDLDKALDSLEQVDLQIISEPGKQTDDDRTEKKLKRVERKFERMASEVINKETKEAKQKQMTSPEIEEKRETEYRQLVSQLSTEEISDFQREYGHLWDEHTFSKSDEWDSKTPESQADAQELPQGRC